MAEDIQAQLDALRGMIAELSAKTERPLSTPAPAATPSVTSVTPFWDCVYEQGITLTGASGEDWDDRLNTLRSTATRWIHFELETATGHFEATDFGGANARRFKILFDSPVAKQVTCQFTTDTSGGAAPFYLQRKINGVVTETTNFNPFTIDIVAGRNSVIFTQSTDTDSSAFVGRLFDGIESKWVDPRNESGYLVD